MGAWKEWKAEALSLADGLLPSISCDRLKRHWAGLFIAIATVFLLWVSVGCPVTLAL
jgi:hypothetical protein